MGRFVFGSVSCVGVVDSPLANLHGTSFCTLLICALCVAINQSPVGERTELSSEDSDADAEEEDTDMLEEENADVDGKKEHSSRLLCALSHTGCA